MKLNENLKNYVRKCVKIVTPGFSKTAVLGSMVVGKWSDSFDSERQRVSTTFKPKSYSSKAKIAMQGFWPIWTLP